MNKQPDFKDLVVQERSVNHAMINETVGLAPAKGLAFAGPSIIDASERFRHRALCHWRSSRQSQGL
jgi:hypothetical protein